MATGCKTTKPLESTESFYQESQQSNKPLSEGEEASPNDEGLEEVVDEKGLAQEPLRFSESITVRANQRESDLYKEAFFSDYQNIKSSHPDNPQMRLKVSLYRQALLRIMQTEFYLAIMAGQRNFSLVSSAIQHSNFYRELRKHHADLQSRLNENQTALQRMMMLALIATSKELDLIEFHQKIIKDAISALENNEGSNDLRDIQNQLISDLINLSFSNAEEENDPYLRITTQEDMHKELDRLMRLQVQAKDRLFIGQPWAMILFEEVMWEGQRLNIRSHLKNLLQRRDSDIYLGNDLSIKADEAEELWDQINREIQPLLMEASRQKLRRISHLVSLYRSQLRALFHHNLIQEQVINYLDELGDEEALDAYRTYRNIIEGKASSFNNLATAGGAILICSLGKLWAVPAALAFKSANLADQAALRNSLYKGVFFGLNSFSQTQIIEPLDRLDIGREYLFSLGAAAVTCPGQRAFSATRLLSQARYLTQGGLRTRLNSLNFNQFKRLFSEKVKDASGLPSAGSSVIVLTMFQLLMYGEDSLWTPEFMTSFAMIFMAEFVFTFKTLNSGRAFLSRQHFSAMQSMARIMFGISIGTQAIFSYWQGDMNINLNRVFFDIVYTSYLSLVTAKTVLQFMVPPFSKFLSRNSLQMLQNENTSRRIAVGLLMLIRNTGGNGFYLWNIDTLFNEEQAQERENEEDNEK